MSPSSLTLATVNLNAGTAVRVCLILTVFLCVGCNFTPQEAESLTPPSEYRELWQQAEACTGRTGEFGRIHWFVVPGHSFSCPVGQCAGWWEGHDIYLSEDWQSVPMVVKHEMVHALLQHSGHPNVPFHSPCAVMWDDHT